MDVLHHRVRRVPLFLSLFATQFSLFYTVITVFILYTLSPKSDISTIEGGATALGRWARSRVFVLSLTRSQASPSLFCMSSPMSTASGSRLSKGVQGSYCCETSRAVAHATSERRVPSSTLVTRCATCCARKTTAELAAVSRVRVAGSGGACPTWKRPPS